MRERLTLFFTIFGNPAHKQLTHSMLVKCGKKGEKKPPNVIENHKNEEIKEAKGYTYETCEPNEREKKIRKGTIL